MSSTPAEVRAAATAAVVAATEALEQAQLVAELAATLEEPEPEPEPKPPSGLARFGLYPGARVRDPDSKEPLWPPYVAAFEADTGIDVVQVGGNQDQRYEGARGSIAGVFDCEVPVPTITCAIQLGFTGGPYGDTQGKTAGALKRQALQATIDGQNDDIYQANLARMKASPFGRIVLRLGSEGDIAYPPHSFVPGTEAGAIGNDDLYRAAYTHVHKIFKAGLGDRARFSYTTTAFAAERRIVCHDGQTRTAITAGYPGDGLVDIVGIDCYLGGEPLTTITRLAKAGIDFARAHRKPAAFDEWGINPTGLDRPAAEQCAYMKWVPTLPLEYASFFGGWGGSADKPGSRWPEDYPPATRQCLAEAWT